MNVAGKPVAHLKSSAEHFFVRERLAFVPSGEGEHQYVRVRKCGANTSDVAARLARQASVRTADVGFAGMKDKVAVTEQWFSVPEGSIAVGVLDDEVEVLEATRHEKKLRRGQLCGNDFRIVLTGVEGALLEFQSCYPNYFGDQRLGRDNVRRATEWILNRRRRRMSRFKQGLYLSVIRSQLFNAVLDARVADGSWREACAGDVCDEHGRPTAPLWGRGRSATQDLAAAIEQAALAPFAKVMEALEHAGVTQDRRPLVAEAADLQVEAQGEDQLQLSFSLPAGCYATVFLAQHFEIIDESVAA